jgi:hypothetical protein
MPFAALHTGHRTFTIFPAVYSLAVGLNCPFFIYDHFILIGMYCSYCGKEIEVDTQFCIHCGNKTVPTQPAVKKPELPGPPPLQSAKHGQQGEKLRTIGPDRGIACQMCGQTEKLLKYRCLVRYYGFFMTAYYQTIDGYICTGCAVKCLIKYWVISLPSLILHPGWGFILAPWTFLKNAANVAGGKPIIGEYEKAKMLSEEDIFTPSRDFSSFYAERFCDLGNKYWQLMDFKKARFYYFQSIKYGIKKIEVYLNYGNSTLKAGDNDSALNATNIAMDLFPENADLYLLRGRVMMNSTDKNKAVEDLDRAEALGCTSPELYVNRARLSEKMGQPERAVSDWRSVIRVGSDATMVTEAQTRLRKLERK